MRTVLITGGFGFIGSNLVRYWLDTHPNDVVFCVDSLTYAARPDYVMRYVKECGIGPRFTHIYADITDQAKVREIMQVIRPDHVIHLAAESHVCRSIDGPRAFIHSNIVGTFNLLEAFRELWAESPLGHRFHHVSTDEVYGELDFISPGKTCSTLGDDKFHEKRAYQPRSPYAASKAASDHLVMAYHHTYGMDAVITNCSNNYGPNQHAEKLIPKTILSLLKKQPMTVYGAGTQVRDWLFVTDHCTAIDTVFHKGVSGETYCVGGERELTNVQVITKVHELMQAIMINEEIPLKWHHTNDRPTDDRRYAIDCTKIKQLGWTPSRDFDDLLTLTILWYIDQNRK